MKSFDGRHIAEFYSTVVDEIKTSGVLTIPRYKPCLELRPVTFTTYEWTGFALPGVNYRFAYAEFMALVCGWQDVEWLARFNKNVAQFSDDGVVFYGAYGPRLFRQLVNVLGVLIDDPDSRQAVCSIWEPKDLLADTKDKPCNTQFYLKVRDNALHLTLLRRSADIIWGVPYDNFIWGMLLTHLAQCLNVKTGALVEVIDSLHLYTPHAGYYTAARIEKAVGPSKPLKSPEFQCTSLQTLRRIFMRTRATRPCVGVAEEVRRFLCV